jgi:hypothetical protein
VNVSVIQKGKTVAARPDRPQATPSTEHADDPPAAARTAATRRAREIARELEDTRLMLQIGIALGLAYVGFLLFWFWATRFRPRPQRSARV